MKTPKGFSPIIAIVIVLVVGLAAGAAIYFTTRETATNTNKNTNQVVANENLNKNANANQNANLNSNTNATVDETAGWKTYENTEFSYSFKYPADYEILDNMFTDKTIVYVSPLKDTDRMTIYYRKMTADTYIEDLGKQVNIIKKEDYTLDGKASKKITLDVPTRGTQSVYIVADLGENSLTLMDVNNKTREKIASTFQFTDETASWKTYENKTYGYSFRYSPDYTLKKFSAEDTPGAVDYTILSKTDAEMILSILGRKLDPNNIQGVYGKIDNPKIVKVGDQNGYQYREGDAGCGGDVIQTGLPNNKILRMYFGTCEEGKNILYTDLNQRNKILFTFKFTAENSQSLTIDERPVIINYPLSYKLEKNTEKNRRGSVITYNITPRGSSPSLQELQIFSRESIQAFNTKCQALDYPCFFGDYPTVERFDGLYNAFPAGNSYQDYKLITLGQQKYLVKDIKSVGDIGYLREYNTFVGTTMVTLWVNISDSSLDGQADALIVTWKFIYNGL